MSLLAFGMKILFSWDTFVSLLEKEAFSREHQRETNQ